MIIVSEKCIQLIKKFEGFSAKPYHGAADKPGVFTIGYGTIKYPPSYLGGKSVALTDPNITEKQAVDFLTWEVNTKAKNIDVLLRDDLTSNQFAALISFTYNLGEGALQKSTLRKKVNSSPKDPTIRDEFLKWVISDGHVQPGLVKRRMEEADLYFKP